jgi:DNA phosphorothioation-dependent restriction protein DptG
MLWLHPNKGNFLVYKTLCKHLNNYVQISPNMLSNLFFMKASIEEVHLCSTNPRTDTITIFANFKNSFSHLVNKILLLIVTHILVTRFLSQGSHITFGAYDFIVSLYMFACKSNLCWHLKKFNLQKWRSHPFYFTIMFFYDRKMEGESIININSHPKLWIHNAKGIH